MNPTTARNVWTEDKLHVIKCVGTLLQSIYLLSSELLNDDIRIINTRDQIDLLRPQ